MEKRKIIKEVTDREVGCLENLVVAYNTVFIMSSYFLIIIAGTVHHLFSDFNKTLSPSVLLFIIGCFIILIALLGYVGVAKKSSSLISLYTMLLVFVIILEISSGLGILSFRKEIKSVMFSKMKRTIAAYPNDPWTANFVDYAQLELRCCGVSNFRDWDDILNSNFPTNCKISDINLPSSCCFRTSDTSAPLVNKNGCLPAVSTLLKGSTLFLSTSLIAIVTIQLLGAYFSYSLATTLSKYKMQTAAKSVKEIQPEYGLPTDYKEKSNYF